MFAERGFAGTSLRDVSAAIGISMSSLIHHFGSKERLYGAVLERLAASLEAYVKAAHADEPQSVADMLDAFCDWAFDHEHYAQLLLRELMENRVRAQAARKWHLAQIIGSYVGQIQRGQADGSVRPFDAEMFVFYVTGAITHFAAAAPTVQRMLGMASFDETVERFRRTLRETTFAMLRGCGPGSDVEVISARPPSDGPSS
ncbi:TetR/AcrR family transcriptional regulator [Rhodoligotrophos ferricapiens]|uniref:TetR/AcrR family transcriptional regulator n=1 Tax=Rhodoligotrophos ferricapiens TaxID=3069264 RepID=UPI00315D86A6